MCGAIWREAAVSPNLGMLVLVCVHDCVWQHVRFLVLVGGNLWAANFAMIVVSFC